MFCIGRTSIFPWAAQWPMFSKIAATSSARAGRTRRSPLAGGVAVMGPRLGAAVAAIAASARARARARDLLDDARPLAVPP
jgi:hypothetical protein